MYVYGLVFVIKFAFRTPRIASRPQSTICRCYLAALDNIYAHHSTWDVIVGEEVQRQGARDVCDYMVIPHAHSTPISNDTHRKFSFAVTRSLSPSQIGGENFHAKVSSLFDDGHRFDNRRS